jgi:hypothetical protein
MLTGVNQSSWPRPVFSDADAKRDGDPSPGQDT